MAQDSARIAPREVVDSHALLPTSGDWGSVIQHWSAEDQAFIRRIYEKHLTYLTFNRIAALATMHRSVEESNLPGICISVGCALGGSSIMQARWKSTGRPLFIYDVFGMIPSPHGNKDGKDSKERYRVIAEGKARGFVGDKYYGYEENLLEIVQSHFKDFGIDCDKQSVSFIPGLIQKTMKINQPVAFAYVDVDWYEPTRVSLERIFPNLVVGGSMIMDDYYDWTGCKKAVDKYLQRVVGQYALNGSGESLIITRTSPPSPLYRKFKYFFTRRAPSSSNTSDRE